eukprot:tig00022075_g23636.t1
MALRARASGLTSISPEKLLAESGGLRATDVESLDVSDNELTSIPSEINTFPYLESLCAAHNSICIVSSLPASLTKLDLSYNKLGPAEAKFLRELSGLRDLDLSYNLFTDVAFLGSNRALHTLRLAGNRISGLTGLGALGNLTSLDLRNNLIDQFEDLRCLSMNPLQHLSLRGNPITKLQSYRYSVLHIMPALDTLDGEKLPQSPSKGRPAWQNPGATGTSPTRRGSNDDMPPPPPPPGAAPGSPLARSSPTARRATPPLGSPGTSSGRPPRQRNFQAVPMPHSGPNSNGDTGCRRPGPARRPALGAPPAAPAPPPPPPPPSQRDPDASFASIAAAAAALLADATPSTTRGPTPPPPTERGRGAGAPAPPPQTEAMVKLITKLADTLSLEEIQLIAESDLATSLFTTIIDDSALMLEAGGEQGALQGNGGARAAAGPERSPQRAAAAAALSAAHQQQQHHHHHQHHADDRSASPAPSADSSDERLRDEILRTIPPAGGSPARLGGGAEGPEAALRSPAAAAAAGAVQELAELLEEPGLRSLADRLAAAAAAPPDDHQPAPHAPAPPAPPPPPPPAQGGHSSPEGVLGTGPLEERLAQLRADRDLLEDKMAALEARLSSLRASRTDPLRASAASSSGAGSPPPRGPPRPNSLAFSPGVSVGRDESGSVAGGGGAEWSTARAEREELLRRCAYLEYRIAKAEAQALAQSEEMQEKLTILRERLAAVERERSTVQSTAAPSPTRTGSPNNSARFLRAPSGGSQQPTPGSHQSRSPGVPPREPRVLIEAPPEEEAGPRGAGRVRPPPPTPTTPALAWEQEAEEVLAAAAAVAGDGPEADQWREDLFDALQQLQALERGGAQGPGAGQGGAPGGLPSEGLAAFLRAHRASLDAGSLPPLSQAQQHRAAELARLRAQLQQARVDRESLLGELNSCMSALQEIQVTSRSPSPSPLPRAERLAALAAAAAAPARAPPPAPCPAVGPARSAPLPRAPWRPPSNTLRGRRISISPERGRQASPERGRGAAAAGAARARQSLDSADFEHVIQARVPHYALPLKRDLPRRPSTRSPVKSRPAPAPAPARDRDYDRDYY